MQIANIDQSLLARGIFIIPLAIMITAVLFTVLSNLTSTGNLKLNKAIDSPAFDFLLVNRESDLELINRKRLPPEEIEMTKELELSQPAVSEELSVDVSTPDINAPNINIEIQVDLSSALSNLGATEMFTVDMPFEGNLTILKDVPPRYPSRAQRKRVEGYVKAEFIIDSEGYVKEDSIKFIEAKPKGFFESSVIRSLKSSKFEPMIINGQAVAYRAHKSYNYEMPK